MKGQALMIVITILALLFVVGVAFFSLALVERTAALRHVDALRARYVAEAGVAYAHKVLKLDRDANLIDSFDDLTFKHFLGEEVDLDNDGKPESRWLSLTDSQGNPFGRFSVKITDEASKLNLNTVSSSNLERLFSQLGIGSSKVNSLISGRPFNAIEQIGSILSKNEFALSKEFLTVYSRDWEMDLDKMRRSYLNSSSAQVILDAFLTAGISNPYQKAANLKDASDSDLSQTCLYKFSKNNIAPSGLIESGSWFNRGGFYEAPADGNAGRFVWSNLPIEDGDYYCFFYAPDDSDAIGEVYSEGEEGFKEFLFSGEGLMKKVKVEAGSITFNIKPAKEKVSRFSYIELLSSEPKNGLVKSPIYGTEALVINELMVKPSRLILMSNPVELSPGQSFSYTFSQIKPGDYHLRLLAKKEGALIGDVNIHGQVAANLYDKAYFPSTVNTDGDITVEIKNNTLTTASFKGIEILQQPDAEYIEVLNLSPSEIDLSNFSLEVYSLKNELIPGWPGRIPEGTKIQSYQHLVLAVDNNDNTPCPTRLKGNRISFQKIWGFNAAGLNFDEYQDAIDKNFDLLPDNGAIIILKDNLGRQVDSVEYDGSQVQDFVSLERADPSVKTDRGANGLFNGWYVSEGEGQATPGSPNDNAGMYTRDKDNKLIKHSAGEIIVFNRYLSSLQEAKQLSDGRSWEKFTISDLSRIVDRFAYEAIGIDLTGHYKSGEFVQKDNLFESLHQEDSGVWEFNNITSGNYLLSIATDDLDYDGAKILVSYRTDANELFSDPSPLLFTQGIAFYGRVDFKKENPVFELKIINDLEKRLVLKKIQLEPIYSVSGRININTAKQEVLNSILQSDSLVQTILQNRPLGVSGGRKLGVGELFLLDESFLSFHNYFTVRSDVYEIKSLGEYLTQGKTIALQTIRSVVERGE